MSKHTLREQLHELAGARQLALATVRHAGSDPETRARARRLLFDIRAARRRLIAQERGRL